MTTADKIRALAADGVRQSEIARRLGVSRQRVASALQHLAKIGRPAGGETCSHCGAPPSAQRPELVTRTASR
jgi:hypothetical protein